METSQIMSIDSLVSYGFHEYPINPKFDKHDRHWSFCKRDSLGKKLYVEIRMWEFSKYSTPDNPNVENGWDAKCQFDMNGPKTFDVTISVRNMTPAQVMDWFENMHHKMGCTYYESYASMLCEDTPSYNCDKCGKFLPDSGGLCDGCQYEQESGGFRPVTLKKARKKSR
jgi:hypothetical protein